MLLVIHRAQRANLFLQPFSYDPEPTCGMDVKTESVNTYLDGGRRSSFGRKNVFFCRIFESTKVGLPVMASCS
jgi:hypothetical protein